MTKTGWDVRLGRAGRDRSAGPRWKLDTGSWEL